MIVPPEVEVLLAAGQQALEQGAWSEARTAFQSALEQQEVPEALAGLGDALW